MRQLDQVTKNVSVNNVVNSLILPFLTGFLFDLPWIKQFIISLVLVVAVIVAGDFIDAIVALWQGTAVAAMSFLIMNYLLGGELSPLYSALSILFLWMCLLLVHRDKSETRQDQGLHRQSDCFILGLTLVSFYWIVPRGRIENFGFLKGEDNQAWLTPIVKVLRGEGLRLVASLDPRELQYFLKFMLNGTTALTSNMSSLGNESLLLSMNIVSNAYVFLLISSVFLALKIIRLVFQRFQLVCRSYLFIISLVVQAVLFFRASQAVGHYSQLLLNCAVLALVISLIQLASSSQNTYRIFHVIVCASLSWALVGSYNPWIPISLVSLLLVFNASWQNSPLRRLLKSKFLPLFLVVLIGSGSFAFRLLSKRYSGLDDGGGVGAVPLEAVWLILLLTIVSLARLTMRLFSKSPKISGEEPLYVKSFTIIALAVLIGLIFFEISFNQSTTVCFVLLLGLLFHSSAVKRIQSNISALLDAQIFDGVVLLALASFGYALVIYVMSRFIGPLYEPMYAASKSMLAVFGQFAWLPLMLCSVNLKNTVSSRKVEVGTVLASFLVVFGLIQYLKYIEVSESWWYQPAIEAITDKPDAIVVCVDSDWTSINYEIYTCNRFMQTLTEIEYPSSGARYLAWFQPEEYTKIALYFKKTGPVRETPYRDDIPVFVLSQNQPTVETMKMFEGVPAAMLNLRVVSTD